MTKYETSTRSGTIVENLRGHNGRENTRGSEEEAMPDVGRRADSVCSCSDTGEEEQRSGGYTDGLHTEDSCAGESSAVLSKRNNGHRKIAPIYMGGCY